MTSLFLSPPVERPVGARPPLAALTVNTLQGLQRPSRLMRKKHSTALVRTATRNAFVKNQQEISKNGAGSALMALSDEEDFARLKTALFGRKILLELTNHPTLLLTPRPVAHFLFRDHGANSTGPTCKALHEELEFTRAAFKRQLTRLSAEARPNAAHADAKAKLQLLLSHVIDTPEDLGQRIGHEPRLLKELCDIASEMSVRLVLSPDQRAPIGLLASEVRLQAHLTNMTQAAEYRPTYRHRSSADNE